MGDGASSSRRGVGRRWGQTVVLDHGRRRTSCGYCRSTGCTSISHGLSLLSIKADDYQDLLDRGWRRSGCFLYKPEMERTCCPSYTIRLKACDFVPSKEQIRVQKRMQRFLDGTLVLRKANEMGAMKSSKCHSFIKNSSASGSSISIGESSCRRNEEHKEEDLLLVLSKVVDDAVSACTEMGDFPSIEPPKAVVKKVKPQSKRKLFEDLLYTSNISFQISALLKRTQPPQEINSKACLSVASQLSMDASPTSVAEKLASSIKWDGESLGLYAKACNGHLNFYASTSQSNTFQASNDEEFKETYEDKK
ncbi:hypothetical protein HPP92_018034 [Vanilla planifolia]|uniref:N-end aminoacyl transferase N-terminal domain-containing protein n=1 Tax=Vanilla planifolia TaxID=51239 RepID=A0A835QBA1_VANPL|nr:hypothetical protein HPP92_018034 [Vanilla planifolia]